MEYTSGDLCPVCESGYLEEKVKDLEFEYNEIKSVAKDITCFECAVCGEYLTNRKESRTIEKFLTDERRSNDGLLVSHEIKAIRKAFGLTQVQFAKALRVGEKNFARYESGQSTQSYAMDGLLRVLRSHPEAFNEFEGKMESRKVIQILAHYRKKINVKKKTRPSVDYTMRSCAI